MKRKISVVTGTRAEYGLLRSTLKKINSSKHLDLFLIVAGMHLSQKFGDTIKEIKQDGFKVYSKVDMVPKGNSTFHMAKAVGLGTVKFAEIFHKLKPDINLVLGDRDEAFASTLAASHMNIPNAHIHGGDRSQAGIDEYNRHAITKLSNIHFAASRKSKDRIIKMGENPSFVFFIGSPGIDEIFSNNISDKKFLEKKYNIKFSGQEIILLYHPVTTQPQLSKQQISKILLSIKNINKTTIAIAPNSDAGNEEIFNALNKLSIKSDWLKFYKSIPRSDYLGLLQNCGVLVGNSSSGIIEAGYFNIPVINIGIRQKNREKSSNVIDVEKIISANIQKSILQALKIKEKNLLTKDNIYGNGKSSQKILKILETISLSSKLINKEIMY
jgi:GDP/UDP-N,N'-diacetylbacillosamine 2-epimerase (hydrolysing)